MKGHVNASGFPLQIAIQHQVDEMHSSHGFKTIFSEHSWKNEETAESGFIDLVLGASAGTLYMIVECKRVRDTSWIFMRDQRTEDTRRHAKTFVFTKTSGKLKRFGWVDLILSPYTPQSEFCVIPGTDNKSKSLIERAAAELVSSTEGFAYECKTLSQNEQDLFKLFFNVIVTTAKLHVCEYDPANIKLEDGSLLDAEFKEVPYVRYRKQLSPLYEVPEALSTNNVARAKESTVFVVNSLHVHDFLTEFSLDRSPLNDQRLR
jgi:hypothetical protein